MKIKVTQQNIEDAYENWTKGISTNCPIANAIRDLGFKKIAVGAEFSGILIDGKDYKHSKESSQFVESFQFLEKENNPKPCELKIYATSNNHIQ